MINLKYFIKGIVCSKKFDSPAIALGASFIAIGALLKNLGFNICLLYTSDAADE